MVLRLSLSLLIFLSVTILPWWVSLIFLIFSILKFSWYYEAVVLVLVYELLYRPALAGWSGSLLWLSLATLVIIPIVEWLKTRLYVFH